MKWFFISLWTVSDTIILLKSVSRSKQFFKKFIYWWTRKKSKIESLPRKQESITACNYWIPAFAGMTVKGYIGLFTKSSFIDTKALLLPQQIITCSSINPAWFAFSLPPAQPVHGAQHALLKALHMPEAVFWDLWKTAIFSWCGVRLC